MQIVIEIDELSYEVTLMLVKAGEGSAADIAVANGIPLPKGHGRLGDIDGIADYFREVRRKLKASDYKTASEFHTRDNMLLNTEQFIRTCGIIEADKGDADAEQPTE